MTDQRSTRGNGDGRTELDQMLRNRVTGTIDQMLSAFDAAGANPTPGNLDQLRADADQAMRALSRVLLEVEHLASRG